MMSFKANLLIHIALSFLGGLIGSFAVIYFQAPRLPGL